MDRVEGRINDSVLFNLWSGEGWLTYLVVEGPGDWRISTTPYYYNKVARDSKPVEWGIKSNAISTVIYFRHWFPVMIFATAAALPWLPWRFSLRTLLIATTLLALVVGLVVWAAG